MVKAEVELVNSILQSISWIKVTSNVTLMDSGHCEGKFEVETSKETLQMIIFFTSDFPLQGVFFVCTNVFGYNHQMRDGSICLTASPAIAIEDKLLLEFEKLRIWIDKYYISEQEDNHYEYPLFNRIKPYLFIFEEDALKEEIRRDFGSFTYGLMDEDYNPAENKPFILYDLGNRKSNWSFSFIKNIIRGKYAGLWVFLDSPPTIERRFTIDDWSLLLKRFTASQLTAFYDASMNYKRLSFFNDGFVLAIGFNIPSEMKTEVHWEVAFVPYANFPLNLSGRRFELQSQGEKIQWCNTTNASYARIFGRGGLSPKFTNSKVLIIGIGAIGSSLFKTLVRGGVKKITLSDGDVIEPGNICRGEFRFTETNFYKASNLFLEGLKISPYVDLESWGKLEPMRKENSLFKGVKNELAKFDIIFDCSTDKYLSVMLDRMNLPNIIINLSITDEANDLAVVTGFSNIHLIKNSLFSRIALERSEQFYVATGCWSPTFKASYNDINLLLSQAVAEINNRLSEDQEVNSFFITKTVSENQSISFKVDYNV